ncbi:hypothetical protein B0H16DRAFT_1692247 [Mycena metata]|uniref:Uncharacterized protein n=1 Tax=Mycena metata TaxID=1033252 RepID=A0AAD7N717_9AGAR|nr:hypothetical protein B0H16DRAFT_1692247 [Mycena metata]
MFVCAREQLKVFQDLQLQCLVRIDALKRSLPWPLEPKQTETVAVWNQGAERPLFCTLGYWTQVWRNYGGLNGDIEVRFFIQRRSVNSNLAPMAHSTSTQLKYSTGLCSTFRRTRMGGYPSGGLGLCVMRDRPREAPPKGCPKFQVFEGPDFGIRTKSRGHTRNASPPLVRFQVFEARKVRFLRPKSTKFPDNPLVELPGALRDVTGAAGYSASIVSSFGLLPHLYSLD